MRAGFRFGDFTAPQAYKPYKLDAKTLSGTTEV
jgi:hypothetical protein